MKDIRAKLNKEWLFWDGGFGSLLQKQGLKSGELPELWNIEKPEIIKRVHEDYLNCGCDIINTNTFGANRIKFPDNLKEIVEKGVELAKAARGSKDAFISLDIGPTGKLLRPLGDLEFEDAVDIFGEVAKYGKDAGADLILIETMSDTYELKAAVLGAKENTSLPVCATVTFDSSGKLLTGGDVKTVAALLEGLRVDALGINCSLGPKELLPLVKELSEVTSVPIIVTPNAGLPKSVDGKTVYEISEEDFSDLMIDIAKLGVQVLGGCCGTTPGHIKRMIEKCRPLPFAKKEIQNPDEKKAYVTSFAKTVEIGGSPKIIGERINPTGKKLFKEALRNNDIDYILKEGLKQEDSGADILDVNVGLPEIDEADMMVRVIKALQSVTALPLQIDTADPKALELALRYYNGKALINSVTGKKESMDCVFPLVAKYGGTVVALPLDEDGIPNTAEGRISIAKKIIDEASKYGIHKKDIVVDGLTLAISSGSGMGTATLETVERATKELGASTILGVSNVSFGLPARDILNANFLAMAIQNGLSCAIINPGNEAVMNAYRASCAILDHDKNCIDYATVYKDVKPEPGKINGAAKLAEGKSDNKRSANDSELSLRECIERGLIERAGEAARVELINRAPLDIIKDDLAPALDAVGRGFEKGEIFLPQLLMSADASKSAFGVLKEAMPPKEETAAGDEKTIILATVKGDIHDIGKNIVKVLLENYGFNVVDLGKDVPPEKIVQETISRDVKLVGLSALMTTTVTSMKETIDLLRKECPDVKVAVGGAVLTQEYADMIGADKYAKDAMETVRYAEDFFKE